MSNQTPERPDRPGSPQGWPPAPEGTRQPVPERPLWPEQGPSHEQGSASGQAQPAWPDSPPTANGEGGAWNGQYTGAPTPTQYGAPGTGQYGVPANGLYGAATNGQYGAPADQGSWGGWSAHPGDWASTANPAGQPFSDTAYSSALYQPTPQQSTPYRSASYQSTTAPTGPYPAAGAPNNDPRAPLGGPVPAAVGIDQFTERRSRTPLVVGLAIAVAVALALVVGTRAINHAQSTASPSPTPSSASARPSASVASGNTAQFENTRDASTGTWTINKYQWDGDELVITTTVTVDQGMQPMGFFAIANDSETQTYAAAASGRPDDVLGKQVQAGQTMTGTVTFHMPRQESTIFITDSDDHQVTALVVEG